MVGRRPVRLLLDTNALIWMVDEPERLSPAAAEALEDARNELCVSIVSLWEVTTKHRAGKLGFGAGATLDALGAAGLRWLPVTHRHLLAVEALPRVPKHRDPFDQLLVAQALHENLTLVTSDRALSAYGVPTLAA